MKKIIFSAAAFGLVAVSSMALVPTTAEAIPAFARQTGAACYSCHFQEVPDLNAFGRSFKMGSFTSVGDQALVEDENLSIPSVLNASFVVRMDVTHNAPGGGAASSTVYNIPVDQNLLMAGRVGTNTGVFLEFGGGAGDTTSGGLNNMQVLNSFDVGDFKVGLSYSDTSFGGDATLITNSVYGQHSGNAGKVGDVSAVNNSGWTNSMASIGTWVGNDMGYIQFALVAPGGAAGWTGGAQSVTAGATNVGLKLAKMIKVAATLDLGGFDTLIGFGSVTGTVGKLANPSSMDMQWVFGQMQGDLGDMSLGIYGDWAHAKGKAGGNLLGAQDSAHTVAGGAFGPTAFVAANAIVAPATVGNGLAAQPAVAGYNSLNAGDKFDAFSIRASLEPMTGVTVAMGYGYRKTTGTGNNIKHQVFKLGVGYAVYQNMIVALSYNNDKTSVGPATAGTVGNNKTTVLDYVIYM